MECTSNLEHFDTFERATPLSEQEYAQVFTSILPCIEEYDSSMIIAKKFCKSNDFDFKPIDMLSIGAGTGNFEERLVKEINLKLNYIYAVEPNLDHASSLKDKLAKLGAKNDIDTSYFSTDFQLKSPTISDKLRDNDLKFDFILMSYSVNCFSDPCAIVNHASNFLRANGKMLIVHQGESAVSEVYTYLLNRSDPEVFSSDKTISNMSMTDEFIVSGLRKEYPMLNVSSLVEPAYTLVDDFIRRNVTRPDRFNIISLFLQANYLHLSEAAQEYVYDCIADTCELLHERYYMRHPVVGIIVCKLL